VSDTARVFLAEDGSELPPHNRGEHFRAHPLAAKVDRAELHARTANRLRVRLHDLRATFVTLSLAAGRSEAWVTDRTGHKSAAMVAKYKRAARMAGELDLGTLAPLDTAIPELAAEEPNGPLCPRLCRGRRLHPPRRTRIPQRFQDFRPSAQGRNRTADTRIFKADST
jgi:hypothetical protein